MSKRSDLEELFAVHLLARGWSPDDYQEEFRFHPTRRWRFDFAWPQFMVAVEIEGGTWVGGRHTRGSGFEKDAEKYNAAAALGWRVFRYTGRQVTAGHAVEQFIRIIGVGPSYHADN